MLRRLRKEHELLSKVCPCYGELSKGLPCYGRQRKLRKKIVPARAPTKRLQERKVVLGSFWKTSESWQPLGRLQSFARLVLAMANLARVCLATGGRGSLARLSLATVSLARLCLATDCYGQQRKLRKEFVPARAPTQRFQERKVWF